MHREQTLGKRILAATAYYTCKEIVDTFREVKKEGGKGSRFVQLSQEEYKASLDGVPEKGKQELYENMAFMTDYGYYGKADLKDSHAVGLCLVSFSLHFIPFLSSTIVHFAARMISFADGA